MVQLSQGLKSTDTFMTTQSQIHFYWQFIWYGYNLYVCPNSIIKMSHSPSGTSSSGTSPQLSLYSLIDTVDIPNAKPIQIPGIPPSTKPIGTVPAHTLSAFMNACLRKAFFLISFACFHFVLTSDSSEIKTFRWISAVLWSPDLSTSYF